MSKRNLIAAGKGKHSIFISYYSPLFLISVYLYIPLLLCGYFSFHTFLSTSPQKRQPTWYVTPLFIYARHIIVPSFTPAPQQILWFRSNSFANNFVSFSSIYIYTSYKWFLDIILPKQTPLSPLLPIPLPLCPCFKQILPSFLVNPTPIAPWPVLLLPSSLGSLVSAPTSMRCPLIRSSSARYVSSFHFIYIFVPVVVVLDEEDDVM